MNDQVFIVSVSGGVDSVVLLDAIIHGSFIELDCAGPNLSEAKLIVAHFDHGIRSDSNEDAMFVQRIAESYGLVLEAGNANLGIGAGELQAREMRYEFLAEVCKKYNGMLITAHHQDDLIETMIINLLRGTGWRGLVSLEESSFMTSQAGYTFEILRPLLQASKQQIVNYAQKHALQWREDSTNSDTRYVRNSIRNELLPNILSKDSGFVSKLLAINNDTRILKQDINTKLKPLTSDVQISRHNLIMWPDMVSTEVIYTMLTSLDRGWHPTSRQLARVLHFAKTALPGRMLQIGSGLKAYVTISQLQFIKD